MSYLLLILGVALWAGAHLFKRIAPGRRADMGDAGRGAVALALVVSIVLMVIGYRGAGFVGLWYPPHFMIHIANLLMVFAFWFFALSVVPGVISSKIRHKQLTGVKTWALAHLLVNGDLASILLFGGMLAWAVVSVILINKAEPTWERPANPSWSGDLKALAIGVIVMGIVAAIHMVLGVPPFPS